MSYWGDDINWISPADLTGYTKKTIAKGAKSITHKGLANSSAKLMPVGSIHFSSRAPIGYVAISSQPLSTNQGFKSVVPAQGIFNEYAYYYLKAAKYLAEKSASGTTFREISGTAFGKLPFPLPPCPEQHQIVAKIEELFSELDNGIESLKKAREQLKTYRQAVLKYAFEGKLTDEWRTRQKEAGNPPEPAEKLLERIKTEREKHYQKQIDDWEKACKQTKTDGKKKPAKPKKPKELPPLTEKELEELPVLPEGWGWNYSSILFTFVTSGSRGWAKYYSSEGAIFLRITNLDFNTLELDLEKSKLQFVKLPPKTEGLRTRVKENDFLFSITGYLGMFAIVDRKLQEAYVNQHISLARPIETIYHKYFGYFFISESGGIKQFIEKQKGAIKAGLGLDDIVSVKVPFCSVDEQMQIVQEIESRLSVCDKLEQTIEDSLKKSEALRQSVLKKAFSGELTKDWRDKHPELVTGENLAEKLLERIRAEKALIADQKNREQRKRKKR